jgi:hypothetical protein
MKVTVLQGREPGQVIAKIGAVIALFPKRERNPAVGSEVEVMITGYQPHADTGMPRLFFVRLIRSDDRLVKHSGFEMSGSMCSTTARPHPDEKGVSFLTPGRVNVYVAENVNIERGQEPWPKVSGWAYVKDEEHPRRIEGVPNIEQLDYWVRENNPEVLRVQRERALRFHQQAA